MILCSLLKIYRVYFFCDSVGVRLHLILLLTASLIFRSEIYQSVECHSYESFLHLILFAVLFLSRFDWILSKSYLLFWLVATAIHQSVSRDSFGFWLRFTKMLTATLHLLYCASSEQQCVLWFYLLRFSLRFIEFLFNLNHY